MKNSNVVVIYLKYLVSIILVALLGVVSASDESVAPLPTFLVETIYPDANNPTKAVVRVTICYKGKKSPCPYNDPFFTGHRIRKLTSYKEDGEPNWGDEYLISIVNGNQFFVDEPGLYEVKAESRFDKTVLFSWQQWIYVPYPKPANYHELAKKYMPIVAFHNQEGYYPKTIDSILNFKAGQEKLEIATISGSVSKTMGPDLIKFLTEEGNSKYYFDEGDVFLKDATGVCGVGVEESSTECVTLVKNMTAKNMTEENMKFVENMKFPVYYQIVEDGGGVYLSYYFIYAFDPKLGTQGNPGGAAHVFDRESFTIVMDSQLQPETVVYGAHLSNQKMEFLGGGGDTMVSWTGGKVKLAWKNVPKLGSHPIVYKAKGAHAIYPTYGWYKVVNLKLLEHVPNIIPIHPVIEPVIETVIETVTGIDEVNLSYIKDTVNPAEPAGNIDGSNTKFPSNWLLEELDLSKSEQSALIFSGKWVDVPGGPLTDNERFPPFIRLPQYWAVAPDSGFDACLNGTETSDTCEKTKKYFDNVKGVGNKGAYAGKLVDSVTKAPITIPADTIPAEIKEGGTVKPLEVYSDGSFTHFIEVANGTEPVSLTFCVPGYLPKTVNSSITVGKTANLNENGYEQEILLETGPTMGCDDGKMEGLVKDAVTNTPLSGVFVQISQAGNPINQGNTDTSGRYYFSLPEGDYTLRLSLDGYIPADVNVHVTPNETYYVTTLRQVSDGKMEGLVKDAVTNTPLSGVFVQISQAGNPINQGNTDTSGRYYFSLPEGDYTLRLSLDGYIPADVNVHITPNDTYYATTLRQVSQAYAGEGIVGGKITDAFNGTGLAGVYLSVQPGVNVDVAIPVAESSTNNEGDYIVNLPGGNYTIKAVKEGYVSNSFPVVSVGEMSIGNQGASLTPLLPEGQLRIVLSWGSEPSDLDSHLVTPTIEGRSHHILYNSKGSSNQAPYVQLDRDWTHGNGPETITIYTRYPGQYCYYVHNYSDGGNTQSQRLTTSEAKVEVYPSQGPVRTYNVPTQGMGTYWNVFCYDGSTGVLTNLNEILATAPQH